MGQSAAVAFRFDANDHSYTILETGEERPHITGMLEQTGHIDRRWYTEESCERGVMVHTLTARYDLGALDPTRIRSLWRGYLLGYVRAMKALKATWSDVEIPLMHSRFRYGGRPDRAGIQARVRTVLEVKSGGKEPSHEIQTALQAILVADAKGGLPAESYQRLAIYLKDTGHYDVQLHKNRRDFDVAREIIRATCGSYGAAA